MIFNVLPLTPVYAETTSIDAINGEVGKNNEISWSFNSTNGRLEFSLKSGYTSGEIPSYSYFEKSENTWSDAPWNDIELSYREQIKRVYIEEGITKIGDFAFVGLKNLAFVSVKSVTEYGDGCFKNCPKLRIGNIYPTKVVNYDSISDVDIKIGVGAFENSANDLESYTMIEFGSNAVNTVSIGENAFTNSALTQSVNIMANEIYIDENAFKNTFSNNDNGKKEEYSLFIRKQKDQQNNYKTEVASSVISIKENAFLGALINRVELYASDLYEFYAPIFSDVSAFSISSLGTNPDIIVSGATESSPVISDKCKILIFNFGTKEITEVPAYFFDVTDLSFLSINGKTKINKNNSFENTSETFNIDFDSTSSDMDFPLEIIKSPKNAIIGGKLASPVHRLAIDNNIPFVAEDTIDFGEKAPSLFGIKSSSKQDSISFSWSAVTCSEYYIYRKSSKDTEFKKIGEAPFYITQYTDKISSTDTYSYKIIPHYDNLFGKESNILNESLMDINYEISPSLKVLNDKIIVSFNKMDGADEYNIYLDSKLITTIKSSITSASYSYTIPNTVKYGTTYNIGIQPIKKIGSEKIEGVLSETEYTPTVILSQLTLKAKNEPQNKVVLTWDADKNASGYKIVETFNKKTTVYEIKNKSTTSYSIDMSAGGNYVFYVYPYRDNQNGYASNIINISIMLKTAPTFTHNVESNTLKLTWAAVDGANEYILEKNTDGNWNKVVQTKDLSYQDKGLLFGKTYRYRLRAIKNISDYNTTVFYTNYSNEISVTPTIEVGNTELSVSKTARTSISLAWKSADNANKYVVYRKKGTSASFSVLTTTSNLTYTDNNLSAGEVYTYVVRPYRDYCASSDQSNVITYTTLSNEKPILTVSKVANSAKLVWTKVAGADSYKVFKVINSSDKLLSTVSTTSFSDSDVKLGELYTYKVIPEKKLINNSSISGNVSDDVSIVMIDELDTTSVVTSKGADKSISVSWNPVKYTTEYSVYRKTDGKEWKIIGKTQLTLFHDENLSLGVNYQYRIIPYCYSLKGPASDSEITHFINNGTTLKLKTDHKSQKIEISIIPSDTLGYYEIYKRTKNGDWTLLSKTKDRIVYDTSCLRGVQYEYRVRLCEEVSNGTIYSDYSKPITTCILLSVSNVKLTVKGKFKKLTSVKISWNKCNAATGYKVYRRVNKGKWIYIASVSTTSYINNKLKRNTSYYYKVIPYNGFSSGNNSNIITMNTLSNKSAKISLKRVGKKVKLSWKKQFGASGYEIYFATNHTPKFKKLKSITKTSYLVKNDKKNVYYYFIRPYKLIKNKKKYGKKSYVAII